MVAQLIDGKAIAQKVREEVRLATADFVARVGRRPRLDVVLVGDDPASHVYVKNKEKAAEQVGFDGRVHRLGATSSQDEVHKLLSVLAKDVAVDGILLQLPVPDHLNAAELINTIGSDKDVDGLTALNAGALWLGNPGLRPCTPLGCMRLLKEMNVQLKGANAVVVGRSALVGKPIAAMLLEQDATVTLAHSKTQNLAAVIQAADVVVAAIGRPELISGSWIKEGAVVVDVGINRTADGRLVGDVAFEDARQRASLITPVPGGVGPMTIAMLLSNTLASAEARATRSLQR